MAAASALGVVIGLGIRGASASGWATALARLSIVALRLRGVPEFVTPDRDGGVAAVLGGAHVAGIAAVWGMVVGAAADRLAVRRTAPYVMLPALIAVGVALAAVDAVLPASLRIAAGTLATAEWGLMVMVVTCAASVGAYSVRP